MPGPKPIPSNEEENAWGEEVLLFVPSPESAAWEAEYVVNSAQWVLARPHRNLVKILEADMRGRRPYVACECCHGFRLVDGLRRRGSFSAKEVFILGDQLVAAVDHAVTQGIPFLDFSSLAVSVSFHKPMTADRLIATAALPVNEWPLFDLKVAPRGLKTTRGFLGDSGAPARTRPVSPALASGGTSGYLRDFACTLHELLGGMHGRHRTSNRSTPPLVALSEKGNHLLQCALRMPPDEAIPSARALLDGLLASNGSFRR